MKIFSVIILSTVLFGCAEGKIDILSQEGELLGSCTADFKWHWYGAQDSVDYMLYLCAKGHLENGKVISRPSIFEKDYSLPTPAEGESWNRRNAYQSFKSGRFSEQKYGYLLAALEYEFMLSKDKARQQLDSGAITQKQYERLVRKAELLFNGS